MTDNFLPKNITPDNYTYNFKEALINNNFSYRCSHRRQCKVYIKINGDNLKKIIENKDKNGNLSKIQFCFSGNQKEHTCKGVDNNLVEIDSHHIKNKSQHSIVDLAKKLIMMNIEKKFKFHKDNLRQNNITLTDNQIKWHLQQL